MGTLTISTPGVEDADILRATGRQMGLTRSATGAEFKQFIIRYIRRYVRQEKEAWLAEEAISGVSDVNPS